MRKYDETLKDKDNNKIISLGKKIKDVQRSKGLEAIKKEKDEKKIAMYDNLLTYLNMRIEGLKYKLTNNLFHSTT